MKKLLVLTLFFVVVNCSGQKKSSVFWGDTLKTLIVSELTFTNGGKETYWIIKPNSDTLEILRTDKIHFIKIGDKVYKIESSLVEVPKQIIWFAPGERNYITPISITDTIRNKTISVSY